MPRRLRPSRPPRRPPSSGSTALSAGLIPAPGTRFQTAVGIEDTPSLFAADIQRKANHQSDPAPVALIADAAGDAVEWLADRHGLPSRSGRELVDALRFAVERAGIDIVTEARVDMLAWGGARIHGLSFLRPDGQREWLGCDRLSLACNGFGGNRALGAAHKPQIACAPYLGHPGNQGGALHRGRALGARIRHAGAYQGSGNLAHPHGILIPWAVITQGGFQVNSHGLRFWNEAQGYSEAARAVQAQPGGVAVAVAVFDACIATIARQFADFQAAEAQGAIVTAGSMAEIAARFDLPAAALQRTLSDLDRTKAGGGADPFGRVLAGVPALHAPCCAVRVTAALFHTQGGLVVDDDARVRTKGRGDRQSPCRGRRGLWRIGARRFGLSFGQWPVVGADLGAHCRDRGRARRLGTQPCHFAPPCA